MNKTLKKVTCFSLATVMTVTSLFTFHSNAGSYSHFDQAKKLLTIANTASNSEVATIKDMVKEITADQNVANIEIGEYVSAYNVDSKENFYLYPVSCDGVVRYTAYTGASKDVTITDNTEAFDAINDLRSNESYLIYVDNGVYYAANDEESIELYSEDYDIFEDGNTFEGLSYDEMYDIVTENTYSTYKIVDEMKLPTFFDKISTTGWWDWDWGGGSNDPGQTITQKCGITNFLRQGNYGICWACTVGTIVNYKTGSNLTGFDVADRMNIGYDDGATIYEIQEALGVYGLSYRVLTSKPSFAQVKSNIDNDKPFGMCLSAYNAGHAITGYGYAYNTANTSSSASTNLVYAWDSNGYQIYFKHNARTINTSGYNFQWYGAVI